MIFFALNTSAELGRAVAQAGGFPVAIHEEREFAGGEHKTRPLLSVRGRDVFVLDSLHGEPGHSANDKLCRLLFFLAACRENGASRITAIAPYLAYSRKDRQTKSRDPVTTRYVAQLFEAVGTDCVVTLDVHNLPAFQNAFRCQTMHLEARHLFGAEILGRSGDLPLAIVSPDGGGMKRAQLLREVVSLAKDRPVNFGFMEKQRSAGVVSGSVFAGDVAGRAVWVVDDMIVGGGTMVRAARACRLHGASAVHLVATHAMLTKEAPEALADPSITSLTLTDSTGLPAAARAALGDRLHVLSVAPLIAQTILHLTAMHPTNRIIDPG